MEFRDVIKARTAVRKFADRGVEPEKIDYILECARLAPSWANRQCWHFVVVQKPEALARVSAATIAMNRWLKKVPAMIVACGDPSRSGTHHGIGYFAVDVAIAMEHLVLAAADVGLGTCWMGVFDEDGVREALGIPDHIKVVALSPLGYPADTKGVNTRAIKLLAGKGRKPLDEIVHWDRW